MVVVCLSVSLKVCESVRCNGFLLVAKIRLLISILFTFWLHCCNAVRRRHPEVEEEEVEDVQESEAAAGAEGEATSGLIGD